MKAKTIASATIPAVAPDVQPITSKTSGTSKPLNEKLKELETRIAALEAGLENLRNEFSHWMKIM